MRYLVGVGNYNMFDDSIGIRLIEAVEERGLDKNFQALDLSSNVINLLSYCNESTEKMVIVDSAKMGKKPGEFCFFSPEQVVSEKQLVQISTHEGDVLKVVRLAQQLNYAVPPIMFMGIEPESIKPGSGLSLILASNMEIYIAEAIRELQQ
jgi:hydrogenase maturation protease